MPRTHAARQNAHNQPFTVVPTMATRPRLERASWIAGIASAIIAVVGLYFLFWPSDKATPPSQLNVNTGSGTVIGTSTGPVTINQHGGASVPESALTIKGRWNDDSAKIIVEPLLTGAEAKIKKELCKGDPHCKIAHAAIGKYSLVYGSKEVTLLLYSSIDDGLACHSCSPFISIFEFEKLPGGWLHSQSDIAVFQWGSWGSMDAANVVARPIGPNTFGISFDLGYTQGGYTERAVAIWAKLADAYQKILHIPSGLDDSGIVSPGQNRWTSILALERSDLGLYPISVSADGILDGRPFRSTTRFEFNGIEYRSTNAPDYLAPIDCIKKDISGHCS